MKTLALKVQIGLAAAIFMIVSALFGASYWLASNKLMSSEMAFEDNTVANLQVTMAQPIFTYDYEQIRAVLSVMLKSEQIYLVQTSNCFQLQKADDNLKNSCCAIFPYLLKIQIGIKWFLVKSAKLQACRLKSHTYKIRIRMGIGHSREHILLEDLQNVLTILRPNIPYLPYP